MALPRRQLSRKVLSTLDRRGCFSFRSALASIWRMRSRVNENCCPTSSSVLSVFMPMPNRMRRTRSSRGVSEASTRVVVSRRFDWIAAIAFLSSMKSNYKHGRYTAEVIASRRWLRETIREVRALTRTLRDQH
jgi:hypothetical protein